MAFNPERGPEQKIDDEEIGKAQQRMADEQRTKQSMGETATKMTVEAPAEAQEEEESQSM